MIDTNQQAYSPPLALTVISSISIGVAAVVALWISLDIIWRRGWKSMMAVMYVQGIPVLFDALQCTSKIISCWDYSCRIPVYVVNALYLWPITLWPITLWTYLKYGRAPKWHPGKDSNKQLRNAQTVPSTPQEKSVDRNNRTENGEKTIPITFDARSCPQWVE